MPIGSGANLGTATARVTIDTSQLREGSRTVQEVSSDMVTSLNRVNTATVEVEGGFGRFVGILTQVRGVAGALGFSLGVTSVAGVGKLGAELARTSASAAQLEQRFGFLSRIAGETADNMLVSMRKASRDHIADVELMRLANRSMIMGVADDMETMSDLIRVAGARAGAVGLSLGEAFDYLIGGIGRTNPILLENIGLIADATQIYEAYGREINKSANELTELEKRQAFVNFAIKETESLLQQQTSAGVSPSGRFQQMAAAATNLRVALGDLVMDDALTWVLRLTEAFNNLKESAEWLRESRGFGVRWSDLAAMATGGTTEFLHNDLLRQQEKLNAEIQRMRDLRAQSFDPTSVDAFTKRIQELEADLKKLNTEIARSHALLRGPGFVDESQTDADIQRLKELTVGYDQMAAAKEAALASGDSMAADAIGRQMVIVKSQIEAATSALERFNAISMPEGRGIGVASPFSRLGATAPIPSPNREYSSELQQLQLDYFKEIQRVETQAGQERVRTVEQYQDSMSSAVRSHQQNMAREAEDFGIQRARQTAQHEQGIARIRQDAALREMTAQTDLAERLADIRSQQAQRWADADEDHSRRRAQQQADFNEQQARQRSDGAKRIADIETQVQRDREKATARHRDTLLNAAASLDARAVAQEMRRWATENQERERAAQERIQTETENLEERLRQNQTEHDKRMAQDQEAFDRRRAREQRDLQHRIAQEQAAHAKRLELAREADERRIEDQQASFDEMIAQQDEDRARRLRRQTEDHQAQLAEMGRAHQARMTSIADQERERLQTLKDSFKDQLTEYGLFNVEWLNHQERLQEKSIKLFEEFFGDFYKTAYEAHIAYLNRPLLGPPERPDDFPSMLAPPGSFTPQGNRSITVAPGAIQVYAAPGMNERTLSQEVRRELLNVLNEVSE